MTTTNKHREEANFAALVLNAQKGDSSVGSGGGHIPISLGYVAQAQQALLLMQEEYVEMEQIQRQANMLTLKAQQGDHGTVMAIAHAIENSADADATSSFLDAGNAGAQAVGSGISIFAGGMNKEEENELGNAQNDLNKTTNFEHLFNGEMSAPRIVGDRAPQQGQPEEKELPLLTEKQKTRLQQFKNGEGDLTYQPGDEVVLQHIKANAEVRAQVAKHINEQKDQANRRINTVTTQHQSRSQRYQSGVNIGQQAASGAFDAGKGINNSKNKGPADAVRQVAQSSDQNVSQAASQGIQQADATEQKADALNRIREALGSNNGTAGQ